MFNPNELILERIRSVEEYDPATSELTGRYTQIEEPSLKTSAEAQEVTDAMGSTVATFYKAQKGNSALAILISHLTSPLPSMEPKRFLRQTKAKLLCLYLK